MTQAGITLSARRRGGLAGLLGPFVIFRLGDASTYAPGPDTEDFALEASVVRECVALPELRRPVGAPDVIAGLLHLGRAVLPVVDLGMVLGFPAAALSAEDNLYRAVMILGGDYDGLGLLVSRIVDVRRIQRSGILAATAPAASWDRGSFLHAQRRVTVIDPAIIFDLQARRRIDAVLQMDRARGDLWQAGDGPPTHATQSAQEARDAGH